MTPTTTIAMIHVVIRPIGYPLSFSDCAHSMLARSNPHHVVEGRHEHLAIADAPGLRRARQDRDDLVGSVVGHDDLELDLGEEVDDVLAAPLPLGVALLAAEPPHLRHRHADYASAGERLLHLVELERLDDRLDLLHDPYAHRLRSGAIAAAGAVWGRETPPESPCTS